MRKWGEIVSFGYYLIQTGPCGRIDADLDLLNEAVCGQTEGGIKSKSKKKKHSNSIA